MAQLAVIIDTLRERAEPLSQHLARDMGLETAWFPGHEPLLKEIASGKGLQPDIVILSVEKSVNEAISTFRSVRPDMQILAVVNHLHVEKGLEAVAAGAENFLVMPFHPAQLTVAVRNALARRDLQLEVRRAFTGVRLSLDELEMQSPSMQATIFLARGMAEADAPVVLEGAPGSGRELIARAIHGSSQRQTRPFLTFNAALVPARMMERALFGSATASGILEEAAGGTLLIRNIDVVGEEIRQRLAEIIQGQKPLFRTTKGKEVMFTGRVMFATNDAPRRHRSREKKEISHFYSQLNALPITVPYLKDIREDIPYLAQFYCRRFAALEGKSILGIAPDAVEMLQEISWPGNIEQLAFGVFNAVMCCRGFELKVEDFRYLVRPQEFRMAILEHPHGKKRNEPVAGSALGEGILSCMDEEGNIRRLEEVEQEVIRYALERYSGHISDMARYLGIGRSTLYRKLLSMDEK